MAPVLTVRGLVTAVRGPAGVRTLLGGVDLDVAEGETVGLVGESGCGKTLLCLSVFAGVRPFPGVVAGEVRLGARGAEADLTAGLAASIPPAIAADPARVPDRVAARWKARHARNVAPFRGTVMAYLHQNSPQALDPLEPVGHAVARSIRRAAPSVGRRDAARRAVELLERLALRDPARVARCRPHELSVGMAKRVATAQALALRPAILFVDEPTTGLDLVVQGEVLELFREVRRDAGTSVVFVSHEIDLLSHVADRVVVLRDGGVEDSGAWGRYFGPEPAASGYASTLLGTASGGR
ncbi:MAG: ABC transporter ATP-binding protein [Deltaproteobacteria bacterium]|nr:ABC transporter ATP-binding protein [Deltaproteobacteria bacterium]